MTRVKVCGITRAEDALAAAELGADYLGFVFVPESPRYVTPQECLRIVAALKAAASPPPLLVGIFRNQRRDEVVEIAHFVGLDLVQLHGEETYTLEIPTIKAFNVKDTLPEVKTDAGYVLFDSGGGTGRTFDWTLLTRYPRDKAFFLAGGITPDNAAEAIETTMPFAIDVASGVEHAPGIKDHDKLKRLFERIQR